MNWGGKRPFLSFHRRLIAQRHPIPINALAFGSSIIFLLLTSACDSSSAGALPSIFPSSPNPDMSNEGFQLNNPLASNNIIFENISAADGISQNDAIVIFQDSDGFIWFGSEGGLNKYDGQNFTVYKHDPDDPNSLSDNWIFALHEDRSGIIWIGILNDGRIATDPKSGKLHLEQHSSKGRIVII